MKYLFSALLVLGMFSCRNAEDNRSYITVDSSGRCTMYHSNISAVEAKSHTVSQCNKFTDSNKYNESHCSVSWGRVSNDGETILEIECEKI